MPRVVIVKHRGCVERPAWFAYLWRRVRPPVEEEQVFSHDEIDVCFGLHVQRRSPKGGRVKPRKSLARAHVVAEDVIRGGCPAERGKCTPLRAFSLCEPNQVLA